MWRQNAGKDTFDLNLPIGLNKLSPVNFLCCNKHYDKLQTRWHCTGDILMYFEDCGTAEIL